MSGTAPPLASPGSVPGTTSGRRDDDVVALIGGRPVQAPPTSLYIPPDAMEVFLEAFEGPLDLLLYLIRRQNLDILEVEVAEIAEQYRHYIELMQEIKLDLAGEYLLMVATLAEIKSRLLLPRSEQEEEAEDPRAELVRRLQEYENIKQAADRLDALPRMHRDIHAAAAAKPKLVQERPQPTVDLRELVAAFADLLRRADLSAHHAVQLEGLSVRERMSELLAKVDAARGFVPLDGLLDPNEGRQGVVVTFLAVLELTREALLDVTQNAPYAPIYVRRSPGPTADSGG